MLRDKEVKKIYSSSSSDSFTKKRPDTKNKRAATVNDGVKLKSLLFEKKLFLVFTGLSRKNSFKANENSFFSSLVLYNFFQNEVKTKKRTFLIFKVLMPLNCTPYLHTNWML